MRKTITLISTIALLSCISWFAYQLLQKKLSPALQATTINHQPIKIETGKVTLINFWATSCIGCVREMPFLQNTFQHYQKDGLQVIGIALSYDRTDYIQSFIEKYKISFPIVYDQDGKIAEQFGSITLAPTSFLIDHNGYIVSKTVGELEPEKTMKTIEMLLKSK